MMILRVASILLLFATTAAAQNFQIVEKHTLSSKIDGMLMFRHGHIYQRGPDGNVAKLDRNGRSLVPQLASPLQGKPARLISVIEDAAGNAHGSDGLRIIRYNLAGTVDKVITPGVNLSDGLVVFDSDQYIVSGRAKPQAASSAPSNPATLFLIKDGVITRSFSYAFFPNRVGVEDVVLNTDSSLALDSKAGLIYQLPRYLYEIRVFTTAGDQVKTITPPSQYGINPPNLRHALGGAAVDPSDVMMSIAVLAEGKLAVFGLKLESSSVESNVRKYRHSKFVDIFDAAGQFLYRMAGDKLKLNDANLAAVEPDGKFIFKNTTVLYVAELR